jgi:hypothetical protein
MSAVGTKRRSDGFSYATYPSAPVFSDVRDSSFLSVAIVEDEAKRFPKCIRQESLFNDP